MKNKRHIASLIFFPETLYSEQKLFNFFLVFFSYLYTSFISIFIPHRISFRHFTSSSSPIFCRMLFVPVGLTYRWIAIQQLESSSGKRGKKSSAQRRGKKDSKQMKVVLANNAIVSNNKWRLEFLIPVRPVLDVIGFLSRIYQMCLFYTQGDLIDTSSTALKIFTT